MWSQMARRKQSGRQGRGARPFVHQGRENANGNRIHDSTRWGGRGKKGVGGVGGESGPPEDHPPLHGQPHSRPHLCGGWGRARRRTVCEYWGKEFEMFFFICLLSVLFFQAYCVFIFFAYLLLSISIDTVKEVVSTETTGGEDCACVVLRPQNCYEVFLK